jgi:hypothetical protein
MASVKEMPYQEKYDEILKYMDVTEGFAIPLVKEELGKAKVKELRDLWEKESEPIPEDASDKDKYEIAYRNFMRNWVSAHNFMRENLGWYGARKFLTAAIEGWRRKYSADAFKLKIVGGISRKTAFRTLAKELAYKLQVFSPFVVSELDENRMILTVNPCKIPGIPEGSDFCSMACQNIIPVWVSKQFNIKMKPERHGADCTVIFEPYERG